jgi:hypothetical protein
MTTWLRAALAPVLIAASLGQAAAGQGGRPRCAMPLPRAVHVMPAQGFRDADEADKQLACAAVSGEWLRAPASTGELALHPAGPEGSGRYWTITIGLSPTPGATPTRGVCLLTSTAGFRSLRSFGNRALPWLADRDGDKSAEAIFWSSFFLTPKLVQSETGLVAWVYRVDVKTGRLLLDLPLSRRMAEEIAAVYKTPLSEKDLKSAPGLAEERRLAADALEAFAADRCTLVQENRR